MPWEKPRRGLRQRPRWYAAEEKLNCFDTCGASGRRFTSVAAARIRRGRPTLAWWSLATTPHRPRLEGPGARTTRMTRTRTWIRTTERSGSSTRAWTCRAAVAAEIARAVRFWPRLWQRHRCGSQQPVAVMPLNGVDQELPTLSPAPPRAAPLKGRYWRGRWTMGRASARCGTRKSAW